MTDQAERPTHYVAIGLLLIVLALLLGAYVVTASDELAVSRWNSEPACETVCWPPPRGDRE